MSKPVFFTSAHCTSRTHCRACRTDKNFRESLFKAFDLPSADFECPHGFSPSKIPTPVPRELPHDPMWAAPRVNLAKASPEQQEHRTAICRQCEHWSAEGKCKKCGCSLRSRIEYVVGTCPVNKWGVAVAAEKATAVALVNGPVISSFGNIWTELCAERGIKLEVYDAVDKYKERYASFRNIITWGVKLPHSWYTREGKNVLFIENGLLAQRSGVYVDHRGLFADSSICREVAQQRCECSTETLERVKRHVQYRFKWEWMAGGNPDGPILIVMQNHRDAPCMYYFPLNNVTKQDSMLRFLTLCSEHLPDRKAIVRPHPRFRKEFDEALPEYQKVFRSNWEVSGEGDVYELLKTCSAMVTTNSTLATEATSLGIPVGVFGQSFFTGSEAVLDASDDPARMTGLLKFRPDGKAVERYLCAVMRHMLVFGMSKADVGANDSVALWMNRCLA